MSSKTRKPVARHPFHESVIDTMEAIMFKGKSRYGDYARALLVANLLAHTKIPSEHLAPVELAFHAMVKRMGGVRNNENFTTTGRSVFYHATDSFKSATRFQIKETNESTGTEPSDEQIVSESVRPNGSGESASASA